MSAFSVIETGGKQYKVSKGDSITIEAISPKGDRLKTILPRGDRLKAISPKDDRPRITFDRVLLTDDGKKTEVGAPYVKGAKVVGELEREGKGKKIDVIKFRAKSRYFRKKGHRQPYMRVKITDLK